MPRSGTTSAPGPPFLEIQHREDLTPRSGSNTTERRYVAWDVTDDVLYGFDTPRYLPENNANAHALTREGFLGYGDGVELLVNARYTWTPETNEIAAAPARLAMVASNHKSQLGGPASADSCQASRAAAISPWKIMSAGRTAEIWRL